MKQAIRRKFLLGLMIVTALFSLVPSTVFAAGNTVFLNLPSGTSQPGNTFSVSVDGHVIQSLLGSPGVKGTITYSSKLLKVVSASPTGSNFNVSSTIDYTTTKGTITFSQSTNWWTPPNNQDVHLFTITFQSLTDGTASVMPSGVSYTNTGAAVATGATYTISTPTPAPAPTPVPVGTPKPTPVPVGTPKPTPVPVGTPKPTPVPVGTPKPTPVPTQPLPSTPKQTQVAANTPTTTPTQKSTSSTPVAASAATNLTPSTEQMPEPTSESDGGLKIENVKITATRTENTVTWTINNPAATAVLTYGTDKNSLKSIAVIDKQDDGSYRVAFPDLRPGTLYYFTIKAVTADSLQGASYSGSVTTRGYPVQLTIEQNNLLLPGAKVSIGVRTFITNKDALIITELGDGKYKATVTPIGTTESFDATFVVVSKTIISDDEPATQKFVLNNTTSGTSTGSNSSLIPPIVGGTIATIGLFGGFTGFVLFRRRRQIHDPSIATNDLLVENYGSAIEDARSNGPTPNLDAGVNQYAQQPVIAESVTGNQQPSQTATGISAAVSTAKNLPENVTPIAPPIAPAIAPATTVTPKSEPEVVLEPQPEISHYSENEQLSLEISQIEGSQQIASDEPSAVYDETTGELDIIHHHMDNQVNHIQNSDSAPQSEAVSDMIVAQPDAQPQPHPQVPLTVVHQ